jgi:aspartate/glutamate racemase
MNKTILIIGGMGPQASNFAQKLLTDKLAKQKKRADIVHISLNIPHFYGTEPRLALTDRQTELLKNTSADIGFIACNTAHVFFDQLQSLVDCKLEHLIKNTKIPKSSRVFCSPTSKSIKIFGDVQYANTMQDRQILNLIENINNGVQPPKDTLKKIVGDSRSILVFGCTEISLQAHAEGLKGIDTLEITIDKIINEL